MSLIDKLDPLNLGCQPLGLSLRQLLLSKATSTKDCTFSQLGMQLALHFLIIELINFFFQEFHLKKHFEVDLESYFLSSMSILIIGNWTKRVSFKIYTALQKYYEVSNLFILYLTVEPELNLDCLVSINCVNYC